MLIFAYFLIASGLVLGVMFRWVTEMRQHNRRLDSTRLRIHVNGIRGKSTVTRILAGMLREDGLSTVAKCTGSAAAVIAPDGSEHPIRRRGAPTILEQVKVIREWAPSGVDALVVECMALNPDYQRISESRIIRSHIGVITNVREDHQDVMGRTLPDIARSLLSTCPYHGVLVTAEQAPELQELMRDEARRRGTRLIVADPDGVTDLDIAGFDYVAFKDNVAIGLVVAELLGIHRDVAMTGMQRAAPDPGALHLDHLLIADKRVTWANLFAVNDRESTIAGMNLVERYHTVDTVTVGILNNRSDREQRALQFADVAALDLDFDRLVTFGAYERAVTERLVADGYPRDAIIQLGDQHTPTTEHIIERTIRAMPKPHVLLVGLVNIHTRQAEQLLEYFDTTTPARAAASGSNKTTHDPARRLSA